MASVGELLSRRSGVTKGPASAEGRRWRLRDLLGRPVAAFILLSTLFGIPAIMLVPPLRGADEPAHFLRAYGLSQGEVVPTLTDEQGRKGIWLPAALEKDFQLFEAARYGFGTEGFSYRQVFADYWRMKSDAPAQTAAPPVFVLYSGSEGYAPIGYLPHVAGAMAARLAGLDFVPMLLLMRLAGFFAMTAVAGYAIALVPRLQWAFVLVAMLPIALFERVTVNADGAALSLTMMVAALSLRAASRHDVPPWQRSLWMTLCVLTKPSQVAVALLEGMTSPLRDLPRRWRALLLIVAPGIVLTPLWIAAVSADVAAWRMVEGTGEPKEHFEIAWKLRFLIGHPEHFLQASLGSLGNLSQLWREMLGELGWRDTHLPLAVYLGLSAMLLASLLVRLGLDLPTRLRIAAVAALTVLTYGLALFLIFYLVWTPLDTDWIHGIQGRYFTIMLPAAAPIVAVLVDRAPARVAALAALAGAAVSGIATLDAIVRSQW